MQKNEYKLTKYACYTTSFAMSATANLSPLLFVTFREMYGVSYTLLGLLVAVHFAVQLLVDLIFTFFTKYFNIHKTVRLTPLISFAGLLVYAIMPSLFPEAAYIWILAGTLIFSAAAGLSEVLTSPVIAAIPSDNPESEMSKAHSVYAWGVVVVVLVSSLILSIAGTHNWKYLALFWSAVPLSAFIMFKRAKLPLMRAEISKETGKGNRKKFGLVLCVCCIFLGGAAECTMAQWVSGFIETSFGLPKLLGDVFGVALFAVMLGLGRSVYTKYGKNIANTMLYGMAGAAVCYVAASLSLNPVIGLTACVLTGLCTSMLWPGTLIYTGENYSGLGVAAYALMAAGGDFGASVAPELVGIAADKIGMSDFALRLSQGFGITAEQIGMRAGILIAAAFPLAGVIVIICMKRYFNNR